MESSNVTVSVENSTISGTEGLTLAAKMTMSGQLLFTVLITGANSLVLIALCKFHTLRDITGIFVANLAVADLIIGVSLPFQVAFFLYPELELNKYACLLRYVVISFSCNASTYSLVCTVFDRLIAISFPLRYVQIMTRRKAYVMVVVIWIVDLSLQSIPLLGANSYDSVPMCLYSLVIDDWYRVANSSHVLFLSLVMCVMYMRIFHIVRQQVKRIKSETVPTVGQSTVSHSQRMNTVVALVVLFFNISWLPFLITQLTMPRAEHITKEKVLIANFCVLLGILNSVVNPIIYAWKNKHYRRAFKKLLCLNLSNNEINTGVSVETE